MAITEELIRNLNSVTIYSKIDDAVDHEASNWDLYNEDPLANESALVFKKDKKPTKFICNFDPPAKHGQLIDNAMIAMNEDRSPEPAYGRWSFMVVKVCLKDIQNPEGTKGGIELKKDSKGFVADETMNKLRKFRIIDEIFAHYQTLTASSLRPESKN
jgi:hypothetical protein